MEKMKQLANVKNKNLNSKSSLYEDKNLKKENISKSQSLKISDLNISKDSKPLNDDKPKKFNLLEFLLRDSDKVLIISLIILLMDDEKNFMLLLSLLYILI